MHEFKNFQMNERVLFEVLRNFGRMTQSSLIGRFVSKHPKPNSLLFADAKRPENTAFFVYRQPSDSLRRHGVDAAILQQTPAAVASAEASAEGLSLRKRVRGRDQSRGQLATAEKKSFLQVIGFRDPNVFKAFCSFRRGFTHF